MTEPKVLVKQERGRSTRVHIPSAEVAWKWVGWLGLVLAVAGLTDLVLLWVPVQLGVPEWEFATVVATTSSLPLVSIGVVGMLAFAASQGRGWLLWIVGLVLAAAALVVVALLLLFLTNVPLAMKASEGGAELGIVKATVKTVVLAMVFGSAYAAGAVWSLKLATGKAREV